MEISKKILKVIIFIIVGVGILQLLTYIFVPKFIDQMDPATARIKEYYTEKKNTIDVLFIGNSESSRGYSPIKIWEEYGITSYNYGSSMQTTQISYYKLKECLRCQKPRVVILEVNSFFEKDSKDEFYRRVIDNWKLDYVKICTVFDKNLSLDNRLSYIFPIIRYHARWNELGKNDFKVLKKEYKSVSYKGTPMIVSQKPYIGEKDYMNKNKSKEEIPDNNLLYIQKIINLCKKHNIKLLMAEVPSPNAWTLERNKIITELANKYEINFIDFNMLQKEINLDWDKDTYDEGKHLNIYGAEKVSNYIGKILSEKYNIPNHKNDANIADEWNEEAQRYEQHKKELESEQNSKR